MAGKEDSYVANCYIKVRDDQEGPLFDPDGRARLDRYAIIPIEEYEKLTGEKLPVGRRTDEA